MASAVLEKPKSNAVSSLEDSSERWAAFILKHVSMKLDLPINSVVRVLERRRARGLAEGIGTAFANHKSLIGLSMGDIYTRWSPVLPKAGSWQKPEQVGAYLRTEEDRERTEDEKRELIEAYLRTEEDRAIRPFGRDMAALERAAVKNARELKGAILFSLSRMRDAGSYDELATEAKSLEGKIMSMTEALREEVMNLRPDHLPELLEKVKTQQPQPRL